MEVRTLLSDNRLVYWIVLLLSVGLMLQPLGLPLLKEDASVKAFKMIEDLPDGSIVVFATEYMGTSWGELCAGNIALWKHLLSRNLRIFSFTTQEQGSMFMDMLQKRVDFSGREYGRDYAIFGFTAGKETAYASISTNIPDTLKVDIHGTPVEKLEVMDGIETAADVDLLVVSGGGEEYRWSINHFKVAYGVPIVFASTGASYSDAKSMLETGLIEGLINSMRGAADYELLVKSPGDAIKLMDVQTILHLALVGLIALGNIRYFLQKGRGIK